MTEVGQGESTLPVTPLSHRDHRIPVERLSKAVSKLDAAAATPDREGKQMLESLNGIGEGKSLDTAYIKVQIDGHQRLLQIQDAYLDSGKDVVHRSIAALARGHIKEHLSTLEMLQRQLS